MYDELFFLSKINFYLMIFLSVINLLNIAKI